MKRRKKRKGRRGEGGGEEEEADVFLTFRMVTGRASAASDRRSAWKATCAHHGSISLVTSLEKGTFFS